MYKRLLITALHDTSGVNSFKDDALWSNLYQTLRMPVRYWVYGHMVPSWIGQEEEIIEDIIQETLVRTLNYLQKRDLEQSTTVKSLPHFCKTIALNYSKDLWRHDCRYLKSVSDQPREYNIFILEIIEDPQDVVVERICQEEVLKSVAGIISTFPRKQKACLLTDLALHTDFHGPPTPLQQAFLEAGIRLEDYQQPLPKNAVERNRYLTSLSTAYKRLKKVISDTVQQIQG